MRHDRYVAGAATAQTSTAGRALYRSPIRRLTPLLLLAALALAPPGAGGGGDAQPRLAIVNYYPADNAWTRMWTRWRPRTLDQDFRRIAGLRATTVRLIVAPRAFGYPRPRRDPLRRLRRAVALAGRQGLTVQLTLFDWWADYRELDRSRAWAERLLAPFAGDRRIAFVELQNELDATNREAVAWARALLPALRAAARRPVALSPQGDAGPGIRLLAEGLGPVRPDLYSAHYFGPPELAYAALREAVDAAGGVPVVVGETGYSTHRSNRVVRGLVPTTAAREAAQEHYFRMLAVAARALGLSPPAPWVLSDFKRAGIPRGGPRDPAELRYGLYRVDGTAKPAAATVRAAFAGSLRASFNNGFERGAGRRGPPAAWRQHGARSFTVDRDTRVRRSGRASARLASRDGRPTGAGAISVVPPEPPLAGAAYVATAWGRGRGAVGDSRLVLSWFDRAGGELARAASEPLRAGAGWQRLVAAATAPAGAAYVRVRLESRGSRGAVWFDDVALRRG